MTQEDKELFKDVSSRLPYGVIVKTPYNVAILIGIISRKGYKKDEYYIDAITDKQTYPIRYIQPYLRPMSSMTDDEREEYELLANHCIVTSIGFIHLESAPLIDWLNSHHFDYRGLIERGLAIEVTEENNPYKE